MSYFNIIQMAQYIYLWELLVFLLQNWELYYRICSMHFYVFREGGYSHIGSNVSFKCRRLLLIELNEDRICDIIWWWSNTSTISNTTKQTWIGIDTINGIPVNTQERDNSTSLLWDFKSGISGGSVVSKFIGA